MRILITGICGFVGSTLAKAFKERDSSIEIFGIDNLIRSGSWRNKDVLKKLDIKFYYGDIRNASDLETLPKVDWVIDAAANPSVSAGIDGKSSSHQLLQHNVQGTINLLEYCKRNSSGFILLSTSRVYSIPGLAHLKMDIKDNAFTPDVDQRFPQGIGNLGVSEQYSTEPPVSLYGSSKVVSEQLALEYGYTFNFPVWINRCGVLAGAGQFGHPMQGIFAFWIHSFREKRPLQYIGFGGNGYQVRDCLHPRDLVSLLVKQFEEPLTSSKPRVINVSGGVENSMSLKQLTLWCEANIAANTVIRTETERKFDIPWMVLDSTKCKEVWSWEPQTPIHKVLSEIGDFSLEVENWLSISSE